MKKFKIIKLDRRYNGFGMFKYAVEPTNFAKSLRLQLFEVRKWCWETWGASAELDFFVGATGSKLESDNYLWAWDTNFNLRRIYLKSDAELLFFQLKFQS
jgi:hypothetical protein